jgi:hypothetical protein
MNVYTYSYGAIRFSWIENDNDSWEKKKIDYYVLIKGLQTSLGCAWETGWGYAAFTPFNLEPNNPTNQGVIVIYLLPNFTHHNY